MHIKIHFVLEVLKYAVTSVLGGFRVFVDFTYSGTVTKMLK